jgi:hypothetical protein
MAFDIAKLAKVIETMTGDASVNDSGNPVMKRVWFYDAGADALSDIDDTGASAYFADAGSTTGTGVLNNGDIMFAWGSTSSATAPQFGIFIVTDAATGEVSPLQGNETYDGGTNAVGLDDYRV